MLPSQVLLNNLLYDSSQLAIPTHTVDAEQLHAPSHWNIAFIRRFMLTFGAISSLFDFLTFALMLGVLHTGPVEFRTGWFVESVATQTLIIFAIRTRRVPFFRSKPSSVLTLTTLAVVAVGIAPTVSPLAHKPGFTTLPWQFYTALVVMTLAYLVLVAVTKKVFYDAPMYAAGQRQRTRDREHRIHRRAARFSHADRIALDRLDHHVRRRRASHRHHHRTDIAAARGTGPESSFCSRREQLRCHPAAHIFMGESAV